VVVPHPLHILGGGAAAEGCVVRGAPGLDAVVDFRWVQLQSFLCVLVDK
jgi:hypothetical protein